MLEPWNGANFAKAVRSFHIFASDDLLEFWVRSERKQRISDIFRPVLAADRYPPALPRVSATSSSSRPADITLLSAVRSLPKKRCTSSSPCSEFRPSLLSSPGCPYAAMLFPSRETFWPGAKCVFCLHLSCVLQLYFHECRL